MAISTLSGVGSLNNTTPTPTPTQNKMYLTRVIANFGMESTDFYFYSTSEITSYNDLVNYLNSHGIPAGTGNIIYCFGVNGSNNSQVILAKTLKNDQSHNKVVATGYASSNGAMLTVDLTASLPASYFTSYEV